LPVNAHIAFDGLAFNQLGYMVTAGIHAFTATHAFLRVNDRHAKKMHLHGPGRTDPDTGKITAGGAVNELIHTLAKGTHGNAIVFFSAYGDTGRTSTTRFFILFNIHNISPLIGRVSKRFLRPIFLMLINRFHVPHKGKVNFH
jgi:hypothetical protein